MNKEKHRLFCVEVFDRYLSKLTESLSYKISEVNNKSMIPFPEWSRCIYILKLGENKKLFGVGNITNSEDTENILYVGGHMPGKRTSRFNKLISSSRASEIFYSKFNFAHNDKKHGHSVAGCLTTSLLNAGFTIEDCEIELLNGDNFDELDFMIGYQERYHHLPPWNSKREGTTFWLDE